MGADESATVLRAAVRKMIEEESERIVARLVADKLFDARQEIVDAVVSRLEQMPPEVRYFGGGSVAPQTTFNITDPSIPANGWYLPAAGKPTLSSLSVGNKLGLDTHKNTNFVSGDGSAGGSISIYSQITTYGNDLVLCPPGAADIHAGNVVGGTGKFFIDTDIRVSAWGNGVRGHGLQVQQSDGSSVMEFPTSGGIVEVGGVLRGANGANKDVVLRNGNAAGFLKWVSAANAQLASLDDTGILRTNAVVAFAQTVAIPAGGTLDIGVNFSNVAHFGIYFGSGAPTLSAAKGSLYMRSDGTGTGDRAYINSNGSTTWVAITTAA